MKFYCTHSINERMKENSSFSSFINNSITAFLNGNFGHISEADREANESETDFQLGAYIYQNEKIWIIRNDDVITVLYPDEY